MTTPQKALQDVIALGELATSGEWEVDVYGDVTANAQDVCRMDGCYPDDGDSKSNADFIVAAVNWVRAHGQHFAGLEAELSELRAKVWSLEKAHETGVETVKMQGQFMDALANDLRSAGCAVDFDATPVVSNPRAEAAEAELERLRVTHDAVREFSSQMTIKAHRLEAELARCRAELAADRQALQSAESEKSRILAEFPLFDESGLSEEFHCEWVLHQDRKRLHAMLSGKGTDVYSIHHDYEGCADG